MVSDKARELVEYICMVHSDGQTFVHSVDEAAALIVAALKAARLEAIEACIAAIELDKSTFAGVGRNTKGHSRTLMLCREVKEAKNADAE
jgi:hypothetical protein